jgi:hypothetical protein
MFDMHPGYTISPTPKHTGDQVKIKYYGLLSQSGAAQVWLHSGYGAGPWNKTYDFQMSSCDDGWEQNVTISDKGQFNLCFKDSADHWDNNNGLNWHYQIN